MVKYLSKKQFVLLLAFQIYICSISSFALLLDESNTISVFKRVSPYVVNVHKLKKVIFNSFDEYNVSTGSGSGFLWDLDGHVVTNYHVIAGVKNLAVSIDNVHGIRVKVVGVEPKKDIAVLKMSDQNIIDKFQVKAKMQIANSSDIQVGEKTIAIGNPFGLTRTLTTGVVSAIGRKVPGAAGFKLRNMIQTDASINPGNSGGPLLNSKGELIGMNTMIYSKSGASSGIGFAVPSNEIVRVVNHLIKDGRVIVPGIGFYHLDDGIARKFGIKGVIIHKVIKNGPAANSGLRGTIRDQFGRIRLGDVIVAINNYRIIDYDELYTVLEQKFKIGESATITYLRGNKPYKVKLMLVDMYSIEK